MTSATSIANGDRKVLAGVKTPEVNRRVMSQLKLRPPKVRTLPTAARPRSVSGAATLRRFVAKDELHGQGRGDIRLLLFVH